MQLYWATTEDHSEDWFIIANSEKEAAKLHELMEGYNDGDATAELVLNIPESIPVSAGWPEEALLEILGGKFLNRDSTRVVEIVGKKFCEGLLEATIRSFDDVFESQGEERVHETVKGSEH
jgi:hypothetical protein